MKCNKQPNCLRRGKEFHKKIQKNWIETAQGEVKTERSILRNNGRKGRVDVFVDDDNPKGIVAIVEIKASNWDQMTDSSVLRNIRRQIKQIWNYIESQIIKGEYVPSGEGKDVCPGIIFPMRPKNKKRMKLIEDLFSEEGIPVVWDDESIEECKARNDLPTK